MKLNQWLPPQARRLLIGPGCALLVSSTSWAQTAPDATTPATGPAPVAPTPSTAPAAAGEQVQKLDPFEVNGTQDRGYYGANTLSGTRINSNVEDVGASITVVTKEQLIDTAALDINDIFKYEANTEGTYDYTAISSASPTTDSIQSSPSSSTRVRGLAAPNFSVDNFVHTTRIPIDTYILDSVEISRGPNSTLFGLGSPAGTVNFNESQANLTRATNELAFRGDSYGGYRSSFDINRPIFKNILAIRIASLYMDNAQLQKPSYDVTRRLYGALEFKPFPNTLIKASAEHFRENRQLPNSLTPRDGITEWEADGRPTWNPITFTATANGVQYVVPFSATENATTGTVLPPGLYANTTTYTRPSMFIDGGQVTIWEVNRLNTSSNNPNVQNSNSRLEASGTAILRGDINGGTLYNAVGINNKSLYDWTSINAVPTNWNYDNASLYEISVEQKIVENLYFRGGWRLEDSDSFNRNITNPPILQMDVNQFLLDGRPNPYYLRPYIQDIEPTIFQSPEYNDNLQAQLAYDLDIPHMTNSWLKWLGHHRVLGYYESRHITDGTFRYREAILNDPTDVWQTAGSLNYTNSPAIGRSSYRYYVGGPGSLGYQKGYAPPESGVAGNFNLQYFNGATGQWVSEAEQYGMAPYVSSQTRQEVTSRGFVDQSSFLDDHFVFTGGLRKDFNRTRNSASSVVNGSTGYYDNGPIKTYGAWTDASGLTRTISLVARPVRWFGLTYDHSDSFQPQPPQVDLNGNVLPNTYGHGKDVGFYVNLFSDKLVLSVKQYTNTQINSRNSDTTIGSRIARIEAGPDTFNLLSFATTVASTRLGPTASAGQIAALADSIGQFPPGFLNAFNSGLSFSGTNDVTAKGGELDLTYTPISNWTMKFTGAQTKATNTSLENDVAGYIALRMPVWTTVHDDSGNLWWTASSSAGTALNFYTVNVASPLHLDQALLGKSNPQVKEYTWRFLTKYDFTSGILNHFFVGGAVRWADKSVIGYLGSPPDPDGIVRSLNVNSPYYDPARYDFDFSGGYKLKFFQDKVSCRIQLNVNSAFESGRLQVVGVNPDGTPFNYRIINPRKFILSTTFDL